jgi:hypothetical protein
MPGAAQKGLAPKIAVDNHYQLIEGASSEIVHFDGDFRTLLTEYENISLNTPKKGVKSPFDSCYRNIKVKR